MFDLGARAAMPKLLGSNGNVDATIDAAAGRQRRDGFDTALEAFAREIGRLKRLKGLREGQDGCSIST